MAEGEVKASLVSGKPVSLEDRKRIARERLKQFRQEPDANYDYVHIDKKLRDIDPEYNNEVVDAFKDKYGAGPNSLTKTKQADGTWKAEPTVGKFEQFTAGFLRPLEKMFTKKSDPSLLRAYQVPERDRTTSDKITRGLGELTGYAAEYLPAAKSVSAAGIGAGITKKLVEKQIAKTTAQELGKTTLKSRFRAYTAKKLLGNMVDDAITTGLITAAESEGDPQEIATGVGVGLVVPPTIKYAVAPAIKKTTQAIKPYASAFVNSLSGKMDDAAKTLTENELKQVVKDPNTIASTVASSVDDVITKGTQQVDDVAKQGYKLPGDLKKVPSITRDEILGGTKERKFISTIKASPRTDPTVATQVEGTYTPITNKATLERAQKLINDDIEKAIDLVDGPQDASADSVATAQLLIDKFSKEGRHNDAIRLVQNTAAKLTKQGQSIQAASLWNRLTPAGILKYAEKTFQKANVEDNALNLQLTENLANKLTGMAEKIQKMPEGEAKAVATQVMLREIADQVPTSLAKKIDTIQTIGQLLNPKTNIRNVIGNTVFQTVENANQTLAASIDKAVSTVTGKRTTLAPSIPTQIKGAAQGFRQGVRDAMLGIDTSGMPTKFDLPSGSVDAPAPSVFKGDTWAGKVLAGLEKTLGITLRAPDRAFSQAAVSDYVRMQEKLAKMNGVPFNLEDATKKAFELGKYRTFQDDTAWAEGFSKIKNALNAGKEFGLGSFVLKYPRTPANLIARGIDYSPWSFVRAGTNALKVAMKRGPFDQERFVLDLSKGLTGSGIIGTGYYLARNGIITGRPVQDKDVSGLQREEGLGQYRLNVSAAQRFFDPKSPHYLSDDAGKLRDGDTLVNYDWLQPSSIVMAIGANAADFDKNNGIDSLSTVGESIVSGVDTIYEQPLFQGVKRLLQGGGFGDAAIKTVEAMGSSFVPTIVSQIGQYQDSAKRDWYDPNLGNRALNLMKMKVPGLRKDLPQQFGLFGQPLDQYKGGTNSFFNVFLNPAFVSSYEPTQESKAAIDLFMETGETKHVPSSFPMGGKKIRAYGLEIKPDAKTLNEMQAYAGQRYRETYTALLNSEEFLSIPPAEQADLISKELSRISADTKVKFLGPKFLEDANKKGDELTVMKVIGDITEQRESEIAKDTYDQLKVMSKDERKKFMTKLGESNPDLAKKIFDIRADDLYKQLHQMTPEERKEIITSIPEGLAKKVKTIRDQEMKKYGGKQFTGLNSRWKAEFIFSKAKSMPREEAIKYITDLKGKGIISDEVIKRLNFLKSKNTTPKWYQLPNQYNLPQGVQQ